MKLPVFEYKTPDTVEEAISLLAEHGDEAKVLAGGQSLLPLMAMRLAQPAVLVDINNVTALDWITADHGLAIGAMTRQRTAQRSPLVARVAPLLAAALEFVAHDAIRTRGTIGGSTAHADPTAEIPLVLTALDATMDVTSARGTRTVPAGSFFQGVLTTCLEPDELLTAVQIPSRQFRGWAFDEFSRRTGDLALVGVAVAMDLGGDGTVLDTRIALSGVGGEPARAAVAESLLWGREGTVDAFAEAAEVAAAGVDPNTDLHGSAEYRRHLVKVLVRRTLHQAFERAGGLQ